MADKTLHANCSSCVNGQPSRYSQYCLAAKVPSRPLHGLPKSAVSSQPTTPLILLACAGVMFPVLRACSSSCTALILVLGLHQQAKPKSCGRRAISVMRPRNACTALMCRRFSWERRTPRKVKALMMVRLHMAAVARRSTAALSSK